MNMNFIMRILVGLIDKVIINNIFWVNAINMSQLCFTQPRDQTMKTK